MYDDSKDCVGVIMIDNYDELVQGMIDTDRPQLIATVERRLREWFAFTGGIMTNLDRNKYLIVFEKKFIKAFADSKFEILDEIKEITLSNKIPVTLSIGIVVEEETENEKFQNALATIDIALGRGGDQAVIRKNGKYEFFGGNTKEVEKMTKVKPRVISQALKELIDESSNVIIMGHKNMDADSLGAAMGIYALAHAHKKEANVVCNGGITIEELCNKINSSEEYEGVLVGGNEAASKVTENTLVVVVDTHKANYVDAEQVLAKANKVVVIDHHRRSTEAIENPVLTFHEVYASSASELVTEILQYAEEKLEITKIEAECLYAGILTDTKNFTQKTGVRTFEAAAYLRKCGVDIIRVKKWFQSDLISFNKIAGIVKSAEIVNNTIAIAINPMKEKDTSIVCAKAADELLTISDITASFVLGQMDDKICISGRSIGDVNVQVILEKLGGGGHITLAGAQVEGKTIEEVKQELISKINEYFSELEN